MFYNSKHRCQLILLAAFIISLKSLPSLAQELAKGVVFDDRNGNGLKDPNEPGIAGVSVTNGVEVSLTNERGQYELPLKNDMIISVIKPSGYAVPVDRLNLPKCYYIHKPAGSPALKYKGVLPTAGLPASVDFALRKKEEPADFRILVFGDPQPSTAAQVDFFERGVVNEVKGIKDVAFGLSMGDLVENKLSLFGPYSKAIAKIGIPWYNTLGNHDLDFDVQADSLSDETFEAHFGPANYAFNVGKVHFIVLDDILYPDPRGMTKYWGGFRKDQLDFVENDLHYVPKDYLVVLAFHIPLSEPKEGGDAFRDEDRRRLFHLLRDHPYTLSLSAHTHIQKQDEFGRADGWEQNIPHHHFNVGTTSGNWYSGELDAQGVPVSTMSDGTPKGYVFIHFNGHSYTTDYKVVGKPDSYQIELNVPKIIEQHKRTVAAIYANFFMGSPEDQVVFRVDSGEWKPMQYALEYAPNFLDILYKWDHTDTLLSGRRPGYASLCRHLWKVQVPNNLQVGEHAVEVKATDRYGRDHYARSTYIIGKARPVVPAHGS